MSNLQPNPYRCKGFASGPVLGNINSGSQVLDHNQHGEVPLSQLPPGYVGVKQDSSSNSPMHMPTSSSQSTNQMQKVSNCNQSGSNSPAFNQPGMMPPLPQSGLQSSPIRPPIKTMTPSPNMFQNPLPQPDLVSSRQNVNTSLPYPPNFSKQPEQINDNTPSLASSQYKKPIMNGPPLSAPIGSFPAQNTVQTVVSSNDVAPKVNIPQPSVANFGLKPMSRSTFGQEALGPPMSKAPTTSSISGPPLSGSLRNSPTIPGPSISSAILVSRPPLGHQTGSGPGIDANVSNNNFAIPAMSGQPMSGPPPFGRPTTGPPTSDSLRGPPPSVSHSGLLTNGPPGPVQGLNTPARPFNQFSGPQKLSTGLPSGPAMEPHNFSLIGQQSGPYGMGSQGLQQQSMRPPTHMGPPTSLGQHERIGTPPNMGPSTGMAPQTNVGPPSNMRPPANMGPPTSMGPPMSIGPPTSMGPPMSMGPPTSVGPPASMRPPTSMGPPAKMGPPTTMGPQANMGPPASMGPPLSMGVPTTVGAPTSMGPPMSMGPPASMGPPMGVGPPTNLGPPPSMGPQSVPPNQPQMPSGAMSNMQNRYPQMPQSNFPSQLGQMPQPNINRPYPQQYNPQGLTQQMGQLSVTKQGFDQLWGHHMVDLMQCRHILPEYPDDPPEIRLGNQFSEAPNCSPEVFRCTVNKIPDTNSLLQKSRLPLGILIHPFKDLNHLPVIQCATIVRCRVCRTYINPFVYFIDSKRWKCNLCYRVNDLPEEFQYDPVSKSYGDPSRRPEVRSATIEFIAPGEYMLRPPQPAVYLFLMDVSQLARESGYIQVVCETLLNNLDQLPGDARTQVGFICYDAHVHYYLMGEGLARPKEMTVLDIDDIFLPSPESLLVNLGERREAVREVLALLPLRHAAPAPAAPACALGAALQAAYKLMAPTGGRITVFQTCLPNVGPGALQSREDPNARSSKDVQHLNPATDFYKRLALDCSGAQIAVDLFLLNSQYADLATLSGMSKFSGGSLHHVPLFSAARGWQAERLRRVLARYLTRKIGFEAVMRVRCTRGISIHTFHGNFFVRSTDLLSLPNVSPDAGFGMQLTIDESLSDLQHVCFQAALLYTSSKGERRIRVHTLAVPVATSLSDVLHAADQQAIIGLLSKMAVDRCASASMSEAREALMMVAVDALSAHRLAQNLPSPAAGSPALHAPHALRLLPLYLAALLKRRAFRTGTSTRLDDRVADMCALKTLPLAQMMRGVYPDLYPVHALVDHLPPPPAHAAPGALGAQGAPADEEEDAPPDPPRLHLTAERLNSDGAYLLDDGETMYIYVCHAASPAFLSDTFGVTAFSQLPDEARTLPPPTRPGAALLHAFVDKLNEDRPYPADILVLRDNSPLRQQFIEKLVDDRIESTFSYYEFLQHVKSQVK